MVIFDALVAGQFRRQGLRSLVAIAALALGVGIWLAIKLADAHALAAFARESGDFGDEADFAIERPGAMLPASLLARVRSAAGVATAMPELDETLVVDPVSGEMPSDRVLHVKAFDLLAPLPRAFEFRRELPGLFAPLGTGPNPRLLIGGRGVLVSAAFAARRGLQAGDVLHGRIGAEPSRCR